jgi:hypothetical protein
MLSWEGKRFVHPVCSVSTLCSQSFVFVGRTIHVNMIRLIVRDGYELRKKVLIHILKYLTNEVEDNIPEIMREYHRHVNGPWL